MAKLYDYGLVTEKKPLLITHWPEGSMIKRDDKAYHLIVMMHPHCPCSRATLHELISIITKSREKVSLYILFSKPKSFPQKWVETDLYTNAQKVPDTHIFIDENSQQARLFGAVSSGQTFLFDAKGTLLFSGGITASRGHEGDSIGKNAIMDILQNKDVHLTQSPPVFGCLLHEKDG